MTKYLRFLEKVHCRDTVLGDPEWFEVGEIIPAGNVEKSTGIPPQKLVEEGKAIWCNRKGKASEKNSMEVTKEEAVKVNKGLARLRKTQEKVEKETKKEEQPATGYMDKNIEGKQWFCFDCGAKIPDELLKDPHNRQCPKCKRATKFVNYDPTSETITDQRDKETSKKNIKNKAIKIPKQLQKDTLWFCFVKKKIPKGTAWQKKKNAYKYNDPRLLKRLNKNRNYGVIGMYGSIMIVDADKQKVIDAFSIFGDTFTVGTIPHHGHLYYSVPGLEKSLALVELNEEETKKQTKEKGELSLVFDNIGHITSKGRMVVGPNCRHYEQLTPAPNPTFKPTGKRYTILKDVPIKVITKEQLMAVIKPFLAEEIRKQYEDEKVEDPSPNIADHIDIPISIVAKKIMKDHPDWLRKTDPGYRGHNPCHPKSKSRNDISIDIKTNRWLCAACASSGYGFGDTLYLIALYERILHCHECKKGGLRGEKFLKVKKLAIEKYGVSPKRFPEITEKKKVTVDFAKILKRDKKVNDLFTGNWKKEPYSLKSDGTTPKEKWTRSEAEHMLLCLLIWYDLTKEQIFSIMDKSKIGKWKDAPSAYKIHQYKSAMKYINKHGGTKTTSKRIAIKNNDKQIATLQIMGENTFCVRDMNNKILFPPTEAKTTTWYSSSHYRKQIARSLMNNFKLIGPESDEIVNKLCAEVYSRINLLKKKNAFSFLDDEKQEVLDSIEKVKVVRNDDGNVYTIYMNGETIEMNNKEIISGVDFTVKYFNKFLTKIIVTPDEWDKFFLPKIVSDEILEPEMEFVESTGDIVTNKFLQYLNHVKIYNWTEREKRKSHLISIYYNEDKQIVLISSNFINRFFQSQKITKEYKMNNAASWASYLHNKKYLIASRTWEKIGGDEGMGFWVWDPIKLGMTREDIEKKEEEKTESGNLDDY